MNTNLRASWAALIVSLGLVSTMGPGCGGDSSVGDDGTGGSSGVSGSGGAAGSFLDGGDGGTGGGVTDATFEGCVATGAIAENAYQPADIIFAIDNSPSMRDEIEWTRENLNTFSQTIADQGINPRIVMISCLPGDCGGHQNAHGICVDPPLGAPGGCPEEGPWDDNNPPDYLHIDLRIPSLKGFNRIVETYDQWKGILRSSAVTHFVVISDDAEEWTAKAFQDALASLDPPVTNYHFHGIYSFMSKEDACAISNDEPCCSFAAPGGEGVQYKELVAATGGVGADLCAQDFDPVFQQFALSVIEYAEISCEWKIPPPPDGQTLNPGMVNVEFIDAGGQRTLIGRVDALGDCANVEHGWYYDNPMTPTEVIVCPQTCEWIQDKPGAQLDIQFGCATEHAPPK